jgi:hypothetical protein
MSTISKPYTYSAGAVIVASQLNSNDDTIYNDYNGNISNVNISGTAGIVDTKLAQITTSGKVASSALTGALPGASMGVGQVEFIIGDSSNAITTGIKGDIRFPYSCTITGAYLLADAAGSIVIDLWKDTLANYPPTVADTITASAKPTLSTATNSSDTTLTGWTTTVSAGDIIRVNVDSATTVTRTALVLTFTRT